MVFLPWVISMGRSKYLAVLIKIADTSHKSRYGLIASFRYNELQKLLKYMKGAK